MAVTAASPEPAPAPETAPRPPAPASGRGGWVAAAIGVVAGTASGLLGVGGGFLIVPLLMVWAKASPRRATGTSLAAILPIAVVGSLRYYLGGSSPAADPQLALFLVAGSVGGAYAGAHLVNAIPRHAVQALLAATLLAVGAYELLGVLLAPDLVARTGHALPIDLARGAEIVGAGAVVGLLSGLTGVGGGIFVVPVLVLAFGLGQHLAQGTSLLAILPTAAVGALVHFRRRNVDVASAAWIGAVGAPAAILGASLALALPQRVLVMTFGAFLLVAAIRLWPRRAERRGAEANALARPR